MVEKKSCTRFKMLLITNFNVFVMVRLRMLRHCESSAMQQYRKQKKQKKSHMSLKCETVLDKTGFYAARHHVVASDKTKGLSHRFLAVKFTSI